MSNVRKPAVSGMFYPQDPYVLKGDIEAFLGRADPAPFDGEVLGMIAPHAGYVYSGQVAAYAYKAVSFKPRETVIVIAPSHRVRFPGVAVWDAGSFRTPLGDIGIDEDAAKLLMGSCDVFVANRDVHLGEHSLEVQLPFLQSVFEDFQLVPLLMGDMTTDVCERAAAGLAKVISNSLKRFLIVGSTDLSHYYPYATAEKIDGVAVGHLKNFDIGGMIEDASNEKVEACGIAPMITTMMATKQLGANTCKVLKYANSGDVSGDRSAVVGYVSALFCKQ